MTNPTFEDEPPQTPGVSAYDERHLVTYLRILDAEEAHADWREVVRHVFGLDATNDADRCRRIYDAHLARARWMTQSGYRELVRRGPRKA